jgi:hypothetical protein
VLQNDKQSVGWEKQSVLAGKKWWDHFIFPTLHLYHMSYRSSKFGGIIQSLL